MSDTNYVDELRRIRDQIGREAQEMTWDQWRDRMRTDIAAHPRLLRIAERAIDPAQHRTSPPQVR